MGSLLVTSLFRSVVSPFSFCSLACKNQQNPLFVFLRSDENKKDWMIEVLFSVFGCDCSTNLKAKHGMF